MTRNKLETVLENIYEFFITSNSSNFSFLRTSPPEENSSCSSLHPVLYYLVSRTLYNIYYVSCVSCAFQTTASCLRNNTFYRRSALDCLYRSASTAVVSQIFLLLNAHTYFLVPLASGFPKRRTNCCVPQTGIYTRHSRILYPYPVRSQFSQLRMSTMCTLYAYEVHIHKVHTCKTSSS
jgi:hypothetical protein